MSDKNLKHKMKQILSWCQESDYCDVRFVNIDQHVLSYYNKDLEVDDHREEKGIAIRVMINGSWGFAANPDLNSLSGLRETADQALALARAGQHANVERLKLSSKEIFQDYWHYPERIPLTAGHYPELHELLKECTGIMEGHSAYIKMAYSLFRYKKSHSLYLDSEGSDLEQIWMRTGAGVQATAVKDGDIQKRSENMRNASAGGLENVMPEHLLGAARLVAKEALDLTAASEVTPQKTDVIIGTNQLALQIHESVGHPNELDRVLGWEANFAGTSFNQLENRHQLQYGSPIVNFVADASLPGGTGTRAYDDDGVKAQRWYIVKDGVFQNYYTSRDTAQALGEDEKSRGCCRADSWSSFPIIRIPNVSLLPGEWKFNDLIADTEKGIFLDVNRSWSIDQRRDQFQFGVEKAYEIQDGKLGRLLKNVVYRGNTIPFWNSCDAICGPEDHQVFGEIHCGKGQPMQTMEMAHGCSPARFRQVDVLPS